MSLMRPVKIPFRYERSVFKMCVEWWKKNDKKKTISWIVYFETVESLKKLKKKYDDISSLRK